MAAAAGFAPRADRGRAPPAEGSVDRARAAARTILDTHTVAPLPAAVQRALTEIIGAYAMRAPCLTFTVEIPS